MDRRTEKFLTEIETFLRPRLSPCDLDKAMRLLVNKHLVPTDIRKAADQLLRCFERNRRSLSS